MTLGAPGTLKASCYLENLSGVAIRLHLRLGEDLQAMNVRRDPRLVATPVVRLEWLSNNARAAVILLM